MNADSTDNFESLLENLMFSWSAKTRNWAVFAAVLCLPVLLYPPWHNGRRAWLFSPPYYGSLDYGRLVLELAVLCLISALVMFFSSTLPLARFRGIWTTRVKRIVIGCGCLLLAVVALWAALQIPEAFPADELALVTGLGGPNDTTFSGRIYNGSRVHVVRAITIHLTLLPNSSPTTPAAGPDERDYQVRGLWIPPLGTATFSVEVITLPGFHYDQWRIAAAQGIRNYWPF